MTPNHWRLYGEKDQLIALPSGEHVVERTLDWLQREHPRNLPFLSRWTIDPHEPYAPPSQCRLFSDASYGGSIRGNSLDIRRPRTASDRQHLVDLYDEEITHADNFLGVLTSEPKEMGAYGSTLIIVMGDHSEAFWKHDDVGHGHIPDEEVARVPPVIKLPGSQSLGRSIDPLVSSVDIMPTVLDYTGRSGAVTDLRFVQGRSLRETIEENKVVHKEIYLETKSTDVNPAVFGIRTLKWKYIRIMRSGSVLGIIKDLGHNLRSRAAWNKFRVNPMFYFRRQLPQPAEMLFDVEMDPNEQQDVKQSFPAVIVEMRSRMGQWLKSAGNLRAAASVFFEELHAHEQDEQTLQHLRDLGYID